MIAVTGATGHLGRLVISSLKEKVAVSDIVAGGTCRRWLRFHFAPRGI